MGVYVLIKPSLEKEFKRLTKENLKLIIVYLDIPKKSLYIKHDLKMSKYKN